MSTFKPGGSTAGVAAALMLALGLAACGGSDARKATETGRRVSGKTIALLLPESKLTRYDQTDRPLFEAALKERCPDCTLVYRNAEHDAAKQAAQAAAALSDGIDVLVIDPVNPSAAGTIVTSAKARKIPVISYDRLITAGEPDLYVSFDYAQVGRLQGEALAAQLKANGSPTGPAVKINAAATDNGAALAATGSSEALRRAGVAVAVDFLHPKTDPAKVRAFMKQQVRAIAKGKIKGVYVANDELAGAAIAAIRSAGIDVTKIPVTGQDADLAAIQRILAGEQLMTIYKAITLEAKTAARAAVDLASGQKPSNVTGSVSNTVSDVASILLTPVAVTAANVNDTVIADGVYTAADVCTEKVAAACRKLGIR